MVRKLLKLLGVALAVLIVIGACSAALSAIGKTAATPEVRPSSTAVVTDGPAAPAKASPSPTVASPAPKAEDVGTVSQRNALRKAESYLEMSGFSKAGLIDQLSSSAGEGFSKADATWAVNHLSNVDWNEQAVRKGRDYLDMDGFSRAGLIQQLSSSAGEKFTKAQATYAADKLGL